MFLSDLGDDDRQRSIGCWASTSATCF